MSTSIVLPPEPIDLEGLRASLELRVFAAAVRDREGPYRSAGEDVVRLAKVLCITLDLIPTVISTTLKALMRANARGLLRGIKEGL